MSTPKEGEYLDSLKSMENALSSTGRMRESSGTGSIRFKKGFGFKGGDVDKGCTDTVKGIADFNDAYGHVDNTIGVKPFDSRESMRRQSESLAIGNDDAKNARYSGMVSGGNDSGNSSSVGDDKKPSDYYKHRYTNSSEVPLERGIAAAMASNLSTPHHRRDYSYGGDSNTSAGSDSVSLSVVEEGTQTKKKTTFVSPVAPSSIAADPYLRERFAGRPPLSPKVEMPIEDVYLYLETLGEQISNMLTSFHSSICRSASFLTTLQTLAGALRDYILYVDVWEHRVCQTLPFEVSADDDSDHPSNPRRTSHPDLSSSSDVLMNRSRNSEITSRSVDLGNGAPVGPSHNKNHSAMNEWTQRQKSLDKLFTEEGDVINSEDGDDDVVTFRNRSVLNSEGGSTSSLHFRTPRGSVDQGKGIDYVRPKDFMKVIDLKLVLLTACKSFRDKLDDYLRGKDNTPELVCMYTDGMVMHVQALTDSICSIQQ